MSRRLVVKLTVGAEAPERCTLGLTVAATALASGAECEVWLAGEATWLATAGGIDAVAPGPGTAPAELLAALLEAGVIRVCSQCMVRRSLGPAELIAGSRVGGAAEFVACVLDDATTALVY